ncbi:hypothetical protein FDUTEX481_01354 [Tolypothrix sp. PCC 7601]|nr:hypothetical protein FDUTEX481_01354 [Tolypothrix sp. PCC 7601]
MKRRDESRLYKIQNLFIFLNHPLLITHYSLLITHYSLPSPQSPVPNLLLMT